MAERVQTQVKPTAVPVLAAAGGSLQRKCACGTHTLGDQCDSCKGGAGLLQRKASGRTRYSEIPPIVHDVLRSPGQPLDAATRAFFEPRFGSDFSAVRVHTDERAAASARAVNALAYTVGNNIVFGAGQYASGTPTGSRLLAHELTHTIQQHHCHGRQSFVSEVAAPGSTAEREADAAAGEFNWRRPQVSVLDHAPRLARQPSTAVGSVTTYGTTPPSSMNQEQLNQQPTAKNQGGWIERLMPSFVKEKELARPIHYPPIDLGAFVAKPTLSLIGSVTYGAANGEIKISEGEFGLAMGGLAKSFTIALVKETGGKGIKGVTFTSSIPGIGKHEAFESSYKPPMTLTWSSTFTPAPLAFEKIKVEGTIKVQLELAFEPKVPAPKDSPVPSPEPVVDLRPLALIEMALQVLAKIGVVIGRTATAPIFFLDQSLMDLDPPRRQDVHPGPS